MTKTLKPTQQDKCHGCELCILESQRQLNKVGLEGALIRIFTQKKSQESDRTRFNIEIDPRINVLNIEKIKDICPRDVFEIIRNDWY